MTIVLNGYKLIRADNPSYLKTGSVYIYVKEPLTIKVLSINNLHECLVCEFFLNCHRSYIVSLYRSPSQSSDNYDHFIITFEQLIVHLNSFKPHLLLITGDFNARSSSLWSSDVDNIEGIRLKSITSFHRLHQIINESTHILPSSSYCIDLIFTNQPNMITDIGVHPSLHQNCYHQIIFTKINMTIFYPTPYERLVLDYSNTNVEAINLTIESFNWENAFDGKDIHAHP